jgi:hypothetical protein
MIIDMIELSAQEKNINILFNCDANVPDVIVTDEQRVK